MVGSPSWATPSRFSGAWQDVQAAPCKTCSLWLNFSAAGAGDDGNAKSKTS
jgi:hypothetical protein